MTFIVKLFCLVPQERFEPFGRFGQFLMRMVHSRITDPGLVPGKNHIISNHFCATGGHFLGSSCSTIPQRRKLLAVIDDQHQWLNEDGTLGVVRLCLEPHFSSVLTKKSNIGCTCWRCFHMTTTHFIATLLSLTQPHVVVRFAYCQPNLCFHHLCPFSLFVCHRHLKR